MARHNVRFDVVTPFSIEIDVYYDDDTFAVLNDVNEIIEDFKPQIIDIVTKKRENKIITKHGHIIRITGGHELKVNNFAFDEIEEFIEKEF
jgi:hypothetical protein